MYIGLLSDTHNNREHVATALDEFRKRQVTTLLHAGDVTQPAILMMMKGFDTWIARGNMDHNPKLITIAQELFGKGRMRRTHTLTLSGKHIALTHGDTRELRELAAAGIYQYVIYGHTHVPKCEQIGETQAINPGALGNMRWRAATCAVLDLATGNLEWIEL